MLRVQTNYVCSETEGFQTYEVSSERKAFQAYLEALIALSSLKRFAFKGSLGIH